MAAYLQVSMPRADMEMLLAAVQFAQLRAGYADLGRIIARVEAAVRGKDLRAVYSKHNTHKAKRPRVELDLRRKAS